MRAMLFIALSVLVVVGWAVPSLGTAHFTVRATPRSVRADGPPQLPVPLKISKERGLLVNVWIEGRGPYFFAVDTGAGLNIITQRLVADLRLRTRSTAATEIAGLTGVKTKSDRETDIRLALGSPLNTVRAAKSAIIVPFLASGVDGILDPTDIYSPYGYSIDMPHQRIETLREAVSPTTAADDVARVPWLSFDGSSRPFVRLGDGRLALVDTGSSFGLAVNGQGTVIRGATRTRKDEVERDIGGGSITSRRVAPTTISIGSLVLRGVPTDILFGVEDDAPVILGREVLYPFKITFDSQRRTIEFVTVQDQR
jgi:hypothetical protein